MGLQATNAGIDFQQRVSAFMMILMEFEIDTSKILGINNADEKIVKIDFEACECIDDLVLILESGKKIFFQMKRNITLSDDSRSEFYKVCKQFVSQSIKNRTSDLAYILMTRSEASGAVVHKLRRVLDGVRLSRNFDFISSLNTDEKGAFDKFCSNLKEIYKDQTGDDISEQGLLSLCMKTYVETLDLEKGEAFEKTIFLMLHGKLQIAPIIFWEGLIARAVDYGAKRRSVSVESLKEFFDDYKAKPESEEKISSLDAISEWKRELNEGDVRFDNVVCRPNDKTQKDFNMTPNTILVVELYRFEKSEKRDYKYVSPNMLYLQNGMELEVLFRSSTQSRCEEFLSTFNLDETPEIVVIPANKGEMKNTAAETMHKSLILKSFEENSKNNKCINCGKAITDKNAYLIEIDNSEASCIAGLVHKDCPRPIDRIIGESILKISDEMLGLNKFDINKWIELSKNGKTVWESMKSINTSGKVMVVNDFDIFEDGNYCICNVLDNGDKHYITKRGKIERFGNKNAEKWLNILKDQMDKANKAGESLGYSSESMSFCSDKQCIINFNSEKFLKIIDSRIEPYNRIIASIYNDSFTFYAPLMYFSVDGEPLILNNDIFPLISNPFLVSKCIDSWKQHGNEINDFEICIIENDNEFILKISRLISQRIRPVVDCVLTSNKDIPLGTPIFLEWEIEAHAKNIPITEI
ncbi:hypothetical protein [Aminipila luticellarii]|uniref:Uncharacterized protein n=1 Tax=Aminipila luticellarii TaxID=2507160 RepID=A0A410PXF6_9FIRM|nr:hypothetical protein [Aminipila luticellarii]QAT43565.1 hypothetical protein EQM06_10225 [Aminipila luticellarii]